MPTEELIMRARNALWLLGDEESAASHLIDNDGEKPCRAFLAVKAASVLDGEPQPLMF